MSTQTPDTRPGPYYVSAVDAGRLYLMAGPYADHATALQDVDRALAIAHEHDARAWFMTWGTVRVDGCDKIGRLNQHHLI